MLPLPPLLTVSKYTLRPVGPARVGLSESANVEKVVVISFPTLVSNPYLIDF